MGVGAELKLKPNPCEVAVDWLWLGANGFDDGVGFAGPLLPNEKGRVALLVAAGIDELAKGLLEAEGADDPKLKLVEGLTVLCSPKLGAIEGFPIFCEDDEGNPKLKGFDGAGLPDPPILEGFCLLDSVVSLLSFVLTPLKTEVPLV